MISREINRYIFILLDEEERFVSVHMSFDDMLEYVKKDCNEWRGHYDFDKDYFLAFDDNDNIGIAKHFDFNGEHCQWLYSYKIVSLKEEIYSDLKVGD